MQYANITLLLCCVTEHSCPQSFPLLTETPHEALLAKLQKTEACELALYEAMLYHSWQLYNLTSVATVKRSAADEASKLRDMTLKTKDVTSSQKYGQREDVCH